MIKPVRSRVFCLQMTAVLALLCSVTMVGAQSADATKAATPAPPRSYALVSAVGDRFTYVRQRRSVGSNIIDNFARQELKVANNALNYAVLRGLDQALRESEPDSKRVLMAMNAVQLDGVRAQDRERVSLEKMIAALEPMPQRREWDRIIVVTPSYVFSQHNGMGSKLSGLGVYVQPVESGRLEGENFSGDIDPTLQGESATASPDGKRSQSKLYVAPFSYLQVVTLDAKTLKVINKNPRHDFQKLYDPASTALNVENSMSPDFLADKILGLIELSAGRAVNENYGAKVEVGDIKPVPPAAKGK